MDIFDQLRTAVTDVIDKRPEYGDATDGDVVYAANTTVTRSVYAKTITIQPGVTVTMSAPSAPTDPWPILYARDLITNRGTLAPGRRDPGGSRDGVLGGPGRDYATGTASNAGPGGGGTAGAADGNAPGGDLAPGAGPYSALFNTPHATHQFFAWLDAANGAEGYGGAYGSSGGSSGSALSGAGGAGGGFVGIVAPVVDNTDGVISATGAAGGIASDAPDPDAWASLTAYTGGDPTLGTNAPFGAVVHPTTPNGHAYYAHVGGTSGSSEPTWPIDGSAVVDGTVHWYDLGPWGVAGGGGGGAGGVVAAFYRQWLGPRPILTAGAAGNGFGGGNPGHAGAAGVLVEIVDR